MLQQTRASVVVPYFERWRKRFPSIEALASASEEEVIKLWEGLGYYARARSLLEGARYLVAHHGGVLPQDTSDLAKVKGLGPYTIGAIQSFAFHQKSAAVDGNVARVISRLLCIEEEIDRPVVQKLLRKRVEELLPDTEPWVIMEALIELGAQVCLKKPDCNRCPLLDECLGYRLGRAELLPRKKQRVQVTALEREVFVIYHGKDFLVQKQQGKQVMAGLYEFPYLEKGEMPHSLYRGELFLRKKLNEVTHTFTRYKARLLPAIWKAKEKQEVLGHEWISVEHLSSLAFSSGHRRILTQLLEEHANLTH